MFHTYAKAEPNVFLLFFVCPFDRFDF